MFAFGISHVIQVLKERNRDIMVNFRQFGSIVITDDSQFPEFYLQEASLYVHWPYCRRRCHFCNFNKYLNYDVNHERMRKCLVREVKTLIEEAAVRRINSVFFGGGTPNLAEPATIEAVLKAVAGSAELKAEAEVTMEANPMTDNSFKLEDFKAAGINRVSIGVQALDDISLRLLGRDHSTQEALESLEHAKKLFPQRTSVDILYGLPGQSQDSWSATLGKLIPLLDDHISVYQLTLERGTKLFKMCEEGRVTVPEEFVLANMYDITFDTLRSSGFDAYEISNFSRNLEARSEHNQAYWRGKQYIGVGPGAHSRFVPQRTRDSGPVLDPMQGDGMGMREARVQTLEPIPWMREVESVGHGTRLRRQQSKREVLGELLAVGLRTSEGVTDVSWRALSTKAPSLRECFAESSRLNWLFDHGLLQFTDSNSLVATCGGWKVLDHVLPHLLDELERALSEKGM